MGSRSVESWRDAGEPPPPPLVPDPREYRERERLGERVEVLDGKRAHLLRTLTLGRPRPPTIGWRDYVETEHGLDWGPPDTEDEAYSWGPPPPRGPMPGEYGFPQSMGWRIVW